MKMGNIRRRQALLYSKYQGNGWSFLVPLTAKSFVKKVFSR
ncbi:hypothetical protein LAC1533_0954 [Ligilactobacillus acidipiscis]|uniref:Uncharacterized protein n=1 Tax=Ligilactobacillus acidipiscis TaxID=89059 RepID=A0A1K1KN98_9LACO|nr:hypothetical protein LAC1533_0954 [Ligilactobacillus acidipiscis]